MDKKNIYKIGDAVKLLQKEYPDLSHSTLRFWEKEGLIAPLEKTPGGQRFYSDLELDLIMIIKELSSSGISKEEIVKKIDGIKSDIRKGEMKKEALKNMIEASRAVRQLKSAVAEIFRKRGIGGDKTWLESIYDEETLIKLLNIQNGHELIEKAGEYKLIFPKTVKGIKKYNKMDEMILKAIIDSNSDTLEQCKGLYETINFLNSRLGVNFGFIEMMFGSAMTNLIGNLSDTKKMKMMFIAILVQSYIELKKG